MKKIYKVFLDCGSLLAIIYLIIYSLIYSRLPENVPVHWSTNGTVNGTISKATFFILPIALFAMCISCRVLEFYNSKRNIVKSRSEYNAMVSFLLIFAIVIAILLFFYYMKYY